MLLLVVALTGCLSSIAEAATRQKIINYEASLRAEADWLWDNMNYARKYYRVDPGLCVFPDFKHSPVQLGDKADDDESLMVEHLDYAAQRLLEVRQSWRDFCDGKANPSTYMEGRLRPAYESLNQVRLLLNPKDPTPAPRK
jgi:hypothetical protein